MGSTTNWSGWVLVILICGLIVVGAGIWHHYDKTTAVVLDPQRAAAAGLTPEQVVEEVRRKLGITSQPHVWPTTVTITRDATTGRVRYLVENDRGGPDEADTSLFDQ